MATSLKELNEHITSIYAIFVKYLVFSEPDEARRREMAYNILNNMRLSPAEVAQLENLSTSYKNDEAIGGSAIDEFLSHPKLTELMDKVSAFLESPKAVAAISDGEASAGLDPDVAEKRFLQLLSMFNAAKGAFGTGAASGTINAGGLSEDEIQEMIESANEAAIEDLRDMIQKETKAVLTEVDKKVAEVKKSIPKASSSPSTGSSADVASLEKKVQTQREEIDKLNRGMIKFETRSGELQQQNEDLQQQIESLGDRLEAGNL